MKSIEKKLRDIVQQIPDKHLDWCLKICGILVLFSIFDIEVIKKIEVLGISDIANTVDSFASPILDIFENCLIKILICVSFSIILLLRSYKSATQPRAIIINHSSFSNAQSSYDPSIVSGYLVKEKEINLVDQMARYNIVDAIRAQDSLIEEVLSDCDKSTELFYYGIAHIPLIFRAGFQIGDEGTVRLLHKYRNTHPYFKEISDDPDSCAMVLNCSKKRSAKSSREMLVVVATSLPVQNEDLAVFRSRDICCELHFTMKSKTMYGFDSVDSYATMHRFRAGIMDEIRKTSIEKKIERIHMVLATSSDFTFFLAQGFSKNHDPELVVYHYDRNSSIKYPWGVSNVLTPANAVVRQVPHPPKK